MSTPKSTVRSIGQEIAALPQVKELLKKYGLASVAYAGGTIKPESFNVRIEFTNEVEGGNNYIQTAAPTSTRSIFGKSKFAQHGLPEDVIGKQVKLSGRPFTIVDVKPQNAQGSLKKCVVIEGSGGGRYVTTAADILRVLGTTPQPGTLIKRPAPGMEGVMTEELKAQFESLASSLSPENLSCDGELKPSQIAIKRSNIMRQWATLETELGRKVDSSEFPC